MDGVQAQGEVDLGQGPGLPFFDQVQDFLGDFGDEGGRDLNALNLF
jgi:hypothetical protein